VSVVWRSAFKERAERDRRRDTRVSIIWLRIRKPVPSNS